MKMDREKAGKLYILDVEAILSKNVLLDPENMNRKLLWINTQTRMDVYLLPNATRLCASEGMRLQYVSEVYMDETPYLVDIFTALTADAAANPVIPIGSTGSLNFLNGALVLPEQAGFELMLNEISGAWLVRMMKDGFIRGIIAPQDQVNAFVHGTADLPQGVVVSGLTEGDASQFDLEGVNLYWLGDSPETADTPEQTLIFLLEEKNIDRVSVLRISADDLSKGKTPTRVSLYLYRDSKNDRMGVEAYNALFFDTPENESSQVRIVSDVLMGRTLEMPKDMHLTLRAFDMEDIDYPLYAIGDHFYILCDGTKGDIDVLNGAYQAAFDGDTFESETILIEGIRDGNPRFTLKEGQTIWPEMVSNDVGVDLENRTYIRINQIWNNTVSQ